MRVHRLTAQDHGLLDVAVRRFRDVVVEDHAPFLEDPATVAFVALEDGEVVGWAWGCRQRHVCGYSQVQLYEIGVAEAAARRRGIGHALPTAFREHAVGLLVPTVRPTAPTTPTPTGQLCSPWQATSRG